MALAVLALAFLLVLVTPEALWAWGPPTHAWLGSQILGNLQILPLVIRELLRDHPYHYLYGSLSADITFAKRYVHYSRHCHNWNVAYEILDRAETRPLQSFALGYMSHLAADTIAHNVFVPRQLVSTPLSSNLGHTYWEYRFDVTFDDRYLRLAREIVTMDHEEPDELLENVLTQAFFSFHTNKKIYSHILHLSNQERWHTLWVRLSDRSRWELDEEAVSRYADLSLRYVEDFLRRGAGSLSQNLDPVGHERLTVAKKLRRQSFRAARREARREFAGAPLTVARNGEAGRRAVATQPIPAEEMGLLAEVFFPEPSWPPSNGGDLPSRQPGLESDRDETFWGEFSGGRALPAGL
jgi:hypothetical protein